jgi:GntR family transcriptional repressor for pyruvate dehydrogenase complex
MTGQANVIPMTAHDVAQVIETEIVTRKLSPGMRLPSERQLSERFGVSRPAVREILRNLETKGLILVHPGRGSFVRELEPTRGEGSVDLLLRRGQITARHLVAARRMLESESASLAAANHTAEDVARLRALLAEFDAATMLEEAATLDVALHGAITIASGNPVIQIMFGSIRNLVHGVALRSLADPAVRAAGAPMHHTIVDAIIRGDAERASAAMTEHVILALDLYGADLDRPLSEVLRTRGWDLSLDGGPDLPGKKPKPTASPAGKPAQRPRAGRGRRPASA